MLYYKLCKKENSVTEEDLKNEKKLFEK